MAATYTSKERCNNERPVADLGILPTEQGHRMPDGTVHPIQIGLRMVEEFRMRVKENIEADPLRAVAKVYEEELTRSKNNWGKVLMSSLLLVQLLLHCHQACTGS